MNQVRIQKILSDSGVLSRRKAEDAVRQNRVTVNGRPCVIGQKADPRKDRIALDGQPIDTGAGRKKVYLMLYKPRGFVTTTSDELGRRCVTDLVQDAPAKVYPVGRLDRNSEGLLLFTNDGDFANDIMHPRGHISKTYRVTVSSRIREQQLLTLSTGVLIDGKMTRPASVQVLEEAEGRTVLQLTIHEGRNRQIRRMCEAAELDVVRLKRVSIGPLKLGMLQPGKWRELKPSELSAIRGSLKKARNRAQGEADR